MRKKLPILLLLLTLSLSSVSIVMADDLFKRTAYDLLQGGWTQRVLGTGGRHCTTYQLNSYPNVRTVITTITTSSTSGGDFSGYFYSAKCR